MLLGPRLLKCFVVRLRPTGPSKRLRQIISAVQIRGLGVTLAASNGAEAPGPSTASSNSGGGSSSIGAVIGGVVGGLIAAAVIAAIAGGTQDPTFAAQRQTLA